MISNYKKIFLGGLMIVSACAYWGQKHLSEIQVEELDATHLHSLHLSAHMPSLHALEEADRVYASVQRRDNQQGKTCDDPVDDFFLVGKTVESFGLDLMAVSERDEERHGDDLHEQMKGQFKILENDRRKDKLENMVEKMLKHRKRRGIKYDVHLIEDEMVNAFSIAGGHLYITTGILDFVDSDDELAGIIGHEIAHVDKKHCIRKVQKLSISEQLMGEIGPVATTISMFLTAPFGQVEEYESDKEGATLAHEAGYDPYKMLDFFRKLKKDEGNYNILGKILRSHPYSEQREVCLKQYIDDHLR